MTPQILLEKIIEKAVKNGWKSPFPYVPYTFGPSTDCEPYSVEEMMFDHSFCKAYFGEKYICISCKKEADEYYFDHVRQTDCDTDYEAWYTLPAWRVHIQDLALTPPEERLSYLGKYL